MKAIIACEFSGIVRDAFISQNIEAVSCDLEDTEIPGPHIKGDIRDLDLSIYDLMIAHPPCTFLCRSGLQWIKKYNREPLQKEALDFFMFLVNAPVKRIAIENPIGIMSSRYRKPDQIIQPWQFGVKETKATCLWLKNLPKLKPSKIVLERYHSIHKMGPSPDRSKNRSRTFKGIAEAFALQWGLLEDFPEIPSFSV